MKRFLVFACEAYYPGGGWSDFKQSFYTLPAAIEYADSILSTSSGGVEVIDLTTETDVYVYPKHRGQANANPV